MQIIGESVGVVTDRAAGKAQQPVSNRLTLVPPHSNIAPWKVGLSAQLIFAQAPDIQRYAELLTNCMQTRVALEAQTKSLSSEVSKKIGKLTPASILSSIFIRDKRELLIAAYRAKVRSKENSLELVKIKAQEEKLRRSLQESIDLYLATVDPASVPIVKEQRTIRTILDHALAAAEANKRLVGNLKTFVSGDSLRATLLDMSQFNTAFIALYCSLSLADKAFLNRLNITSIDHLAERVRNFGEILDRGFTSAAHIAQEVHEIVTNSAQDLEIIVNAFLTANNTSTQFLSRRAQAVVNIVV